MTDFQVIAVLITLTAMFAYINARILPQSDVAR
jgi:hypothetical protein